MNEQIKQLAFQAMSINQKVSDDAFFVDVSKLKEFEKFAELIVGECVNLCYDRAYQGTFGSVADGAMLCANDIKEHFGVEE
jgi:hypothetical protein